MAESRQEDGMKEKKAGETRRRGWKCISSGREEQKTQRKQN